MSKRNLRTTAVAVALMGSAVPALAIPIYTTGSFALGGFTTTTTDVTTTKSFNLSPTSFIIGSPTGSFSAVALPLTLPAFNPINFLNQSSFDFVDSLLGSFSANATPANLLSTVAGLNASATWNVVGTFTTGTDWANPGTLLTANETWTLNQTGGPDHAISLSATFSSPQAAIGVPEPSTLALLGAGLFGLGAMLRRRKVRAV